MRMPIVITALLLAPAIAVAQGTASASAEARVEAQASVKRPEGSAIPEGFSSETRARLSAMLEVARKKQVPTEPMTDRMAEGQAKGASEGQIVAASAEVLAELLAGGPAQAGVKLDLPARIGLERALSAVDAAASATAVVRLGLLGGLTRKP